MTTDHTSTETELDVKLERINNILAQFGLDALYLKRTDNFAWATCGRASYINTADAVGNASLLITSRNRFVLTDNIESARLMEEEGLAAQGWDFKISPWYEQIDQVAQLTRGMKLGVDVCFPNALDVSGAIAHVRSQLTEEEGKRFRVLGKLCSEGMQEATHGVKPGMTEYEIAGSLSQAVESRGVQAVVNLIAVDERIFSFRHPLPTGQKLRNYAMLIVCGRKWGLICSMTRLIHFEKLPEEIRCKAQAVAEVDAAMIAATRPGATMGEVFCKMQDAYASVGFPGEWQKHHQGGLAGYAPREVIANPLSREPILMGQVFAWNPSITGVKSEDTILVDGQSNEILTEMIDWPTIDIQVDGQVIKRPAILEAV